MFCKSLVGAFLLTAVVTAQDKPAPDDPFRNGPITTLNGGAAQLLRHEEVRKELKLSEEQIKKAVEIQGKISIKARDNFMKAQTRTGAEYMTEHQRDINALAAQGTAWAKEILTPDQFDRLKQLERQYLGMSAIFQDDVREALHLADDQKAKFREINIRRARLESDYRRAGGSREYLEKRRSEIEQAAVKEAIDDFSSEQKAAWDKLLGKPFDVAALRGPPPGASAPPPGAGGAPPKLIPAPRLDRIPAPPYHAGEFTRLLSSYAVQKELQLTEDQIVGLRKQLDQARTELAAFHKGADELPRDLTPTERQDKQRELQEPAIAIERKMVTQSLTAEQRERFRQIVVQSDGPIAFGREEVLAALKLTPEQVDKIARIVLNHQNAVAQSGRPVGGGRMRAPDKQQTGQPGAGGQILVLDPAKVRELAQQAVEKAVAVLSDDQKAKWKELIGEPFVKK